LLSSWAPRFRSIGCCLGFVMLTGGANAQLVDKTQTPNTAREGINKSLADEIGAGRGDVMTPGSSAYIIARDPFRSVRRGRQLFQRKFTHAEGMGPRVGDGSGEIDTNPALGGGLTDSCASCHSRPRGSAGFGGNVATRPDSRDAPHLFGLGLKEMLADEITADLRSIRSRAIAEVGPRSYGVTRPLVSKGIDYGTITIRPDRSVDTSQVRGVDPDLRVRPFAAHGQTISIREFVVGALQNEMGLQAVDPELAQAAAGGRMTTSAGMVLDGSRDRIEGSTASDEGVDPDEDGVANEIPTSLVDHLEFYLLNYFKPATYRQTAVTAQGRRVFSAIGCASCHVPNLMITRDRRIADVETVYDPQHGIFNSLFATATRLVSATPDGSGFPDIQRPRLQPFLVRNIFTDFKRHDLGPDLHERQYDGTVRTEFMTSPLWGVGSTAPYGHDGRSINLTEVILRHRGEADGVRNRFLALDSSGREALIVFLQSLVLFPPDDTASNLDRGDESAKGFPQLGHGSIRLSALFNDPSDPE
jgi:Di-haem oxidoreductase, putative peroxidase